MHLVQDTALQIIIPTPSKLKQKTDDISYYSTFFKLLTCRKNNQILMVSISFSDLIAPVTTFYTIALKVLPRIKTNMIELLNLWIQPQ